MTDAAASLKRRRGRPPGSGHPNALTTKQAQAVAVYLRTGNAQQAMAETGYSPSYASSFMKVPAVAAAIAAARNALAVEGEFNLKALMRELQDGALFARETGNATALARFTELKAKACGLLIERIDQRQVAGFTIRIAGIDDDPPAPAGTTGTADIFEGL
jgi:hypothetical protein